MPHKERIGSAANYRRAAIWDRIRPAALGLRTIGSWGDPGMPMAATAHDTKLVKAVQLGRSSKRIGAPSRYASTFSTLCR